MRYASAVVPTGDGLYRNVLLSTVGGGGGGGGSGSGTGCESDGGGGSRSLNVVHPAEIVDQACRGLFPLGFLICNIFYWTYYLVLAVDDTDYH